MSKEKFYSLLIEGWSGKKQIDVSKVKIDMSKIYPIEKVIIPSDCNTEDNYQKTPGRPSF